MKELDEAVMLRLTSAFSSYTVSTVSIGTYSVTFGLFFMWNDWLARMCKHGS